MNQIKHTRHWNPHYTQNFKTDKEQHKTVSWTDLMTPIIRLGWRLGERSNQTRRRSFRHFSAAKPESQKIPANPLPLSSIQRLKLFLKTLKNSAFYPFSEKLCRERTQLATLACLGNRGSSLKDGVMIASRFFWTATSVRRIVGQDGNTPNG